MILLLGFGTGSRVIGARGAWFFYSGVFCILISREGPGQVNISLRITLSIELGGRYAAGY